MSAFLKTLRGITTTSVDAENESFFSLYQPYLVPEWRSKYLKYDNLKDLYKVCKRTRGNQVLLDFDIELHNSIEEVVYFLDTFLVDLEAQIESLSSSLDALDKAEESKVANDQSQRTLEREIRRLYDRTKDYQNFYELNEFVIYKVAKKFEKLIDVDSDKNQDFELWKSYQSYALFSESLVPKAADIERLKKRCNAIYSKVFRSTYQALAEGELDYVKNTNLENKWDLVLLGVKAGVIVNIFAWIIIDSFEKSSSSSSFDFFKSPSIFIYMCIGNCILFKLTWSFNVWYWSDNDVNYISLLQLINVKSNPQLILNESLTLLLIYSINLLIYFRANSSVSYIYGSFFSYLTPFLLVIIVIGYIIFLNIYYHNFDVESSRGLFTFAVFKRIFSTPFVPVTFRDNYACDVLTSFTKVISDGIFMSCYFISGTFTKSTHVNDMTAADFGNNGIHCHNNYMIYASSFCVLVPLTLRLSQCLRNIYDTKCLHPHLANAVKYMSSMLVVLYSMYRPGTVDQVVILVLVTFYKWWWDVVMDWGLLSELPFSRTDMDSYLFLRKELMYPNVWVYYAAILANLFLRFLYVISLVVSTTSVPYVGPALFFFLGSLEILRRSIWGIFRVEYEHTKFVVKRAIGYKPTYSMRKQLVMNSPYAAQVGKPRRSLERRKSFKHNLVQSDSDDNLDLSQSNSVNNNTNTNTNDNINNHNNSTFSRHSTTKHKNNSGNNNDNSGSSNNNSKNDFHDVDLSVELRSRVKSQPKGGGD